MSGDRAAVVTNIVAAVVGVAVVVVLVLLVGADASLTTTDRDHRPLPPAADPRGIAALRDQGDPAPVLPAPPAAPRPGAPRACTDGDLDVAIDDLVDDGGQRRVALIWRNGASTPCRLDGFGVVDLLGPAAPPFGYSRYGSDLIVARDDVAARPVDLGPGETARALVRWTPPGPAAPGRVAWTPDRVVVAFPGEGGNQSLPWRYGPVLAPDGRALRSDASVGPVVAD